MPLQFECPACKSVLRVGEDCAGRRGKCPDCGAAVTVPQAGRKPLKQVALSDIWPESTAAKASASDTDKLPEPTKIASTPASDQPLRFAPDVDRSQPARLLSEATPQEMLRELHRRNLSAVLVQFPPPSSGNYKLAEQPEIKVRCLSTQDIDGEGLRAVLESLGALADRGLEDRADLSTSDQPFDLKGDRLGMSLVDFKRKYGRPQGASDGMVWSSENSAGRVEVELQSEAWHAAAGIVHCRVDLPVERTQPTIAGVPVQLLLYQFVDERLFRISAYFDTDQFHVISDAMQRKYGEPTSQISQPRQMEWRNRVSVIVLARGSIRPPMPSLLQFVHLELLGEAESRAPRQDEDL